MAVAEDVVEKVGYQAGEILFDALIHQQSPDIAQGVQNSMESRKQHAAGEEWKMGAGDQGVMTGYACSETKQFFAPSRGTSTPDCPGIVGLQDQ